MDSNAGIALVTSNPPISKSEPRLSPHAIHESLLTSALSAATREFQHHFVQVLALLSISALLPSFLFVFPSGIPSSNSLPRNWVKVLTSLSATMLTGSEIAKHKSSDSCWMVIHGRVYDMTRFLDKHPGGRSILLKQAGAVRAHPLIPR